MNGLNDLLQATGTNTFDWLVFMLAFAIAFPLVVMITNEALRQRRNKKDRKRRLDKYLFKRGQK